MKRVRICNGKHSMLMWITGCELCNKLEVSGVGRAELDNPEKTFAEIIESAREREYSIEEV